MLFSAETCKITGSPLKVEPIIYIHYTVYIYIHSVRVWECTPFITRTLSVLYCCIFAKYKMLLTNTVYRDCLCLIVETILKYCFKDCQWLRWDSNFYWLSTVIYYTVLHCWIWTLSVKFQKHYSSCIGPGKSYHKCRFFMIIIGYTVCVVNLFASYGDDKLHGEFPTG